MYKEACLVHIILKGLHERENTFSNVLWKTWTGWTETLKLPPWLNASANIHVLSKTYTLLSCSSTGLFKELSMWNRASSWIFRGIQEYKLYPCMALVKNFLKITVWTWPNFLIFFPLPCSIGLAQKFVRVFHAMEKPKRTFGPTQ